MERYLIDYIAQLANLRKFVAQSSLHYCGVPLVASTVLSKALLTDAFLACRVQIARVVSRIVPPQEVEDIVQATYVRVCQYNAGAQIEEPKALMFSVARNLALDHVKRAEYKLTSTFGDESQLEAALLAHSVDDACSAASSNEDFAKFCEAVRRLPVQCRRVFVLKKVYGYSQREIARELGVTESTVEKHIATGMHQCIRFMRDQKLPAERQSTGRSRTTVVRRDLHD